MHVVQIMRPAAGRKQGRGSSTTARSLKPKELLEHRVRETKLTQTGRGARCRQLGSRHGLFFHVFCFMVSSRDGFPKLSKTQSYALRNVPGCLCK